MKKITLLKSLFVAFLLSCTALLSAVDYVKVTTAPADWSGTYLIVSEDGNVALTDAVDAANNGTAVTIVDGKITTDENIAFTIATIDGGGYSIQGPNGKYIGSTANSNELKTGTTPYTNTITLENDGSVKIVGASSVLRYNASKDNLRFRYFKATTYTAQKPVQLYKLVSGEEGGDIVDPEEPTPDPEEPEVSEVKKVTVAEFIATSVSTEVWYELTGVISRIASADYGNIDLTDATGTIYIYGLTKTQVSSNDKSFASLGLAVNDTVTIRSVRGEFNGDPQGGGKTTPAYLIAVSKYVDQEGGETPDPEDPEVELPEGATQETIDLSKGYENAELLDNVEALNAILTFAQNGGGTAPAWYTSGSAARLYGKNSLTITAKAGFKLYQVKFGFVTGKDMPDANNSEVTDGTYDYATHTWTAKDMSGAASMSISNKNSSGHFRIQNIVITYVPSLEVVAKPIFSVSSKNFTEPFELKISCVTEDAKIYYTFVENGKFEEYTTALNIKETTTVYAKAVLGTDESEVVSATYTYVAPVVVTVAEFLAATENDGILYELTGVVSNIAETTYGNLDLVDATGTIYVYGLKANVTAGNQTFAQIEGLDEGDTLTLRGYRGAYKGTPQVVNAYYVSHKDYEGGPTTSVENTKLSDIYTLNRTIVAEGEFQIFTITGQNVTDMNGNLANGVYVVRTANAAAKVVIK